MAEEEVRRGDVYFADLSPVVGSEQGGSRPVLVIQNNVGNHYSRTVIVAAITSRIDKPKMPTHVGLVEGVDGIERNSVVLLEQIRTIDKQRLQDKMTTLSQTKMVAVDQALAISVGIRQV
ncbi:type II toxin-antitoxin system PemK/MazF family toxin [Lacticaseibacillus yichunensis]|uniref:mRNA interferase n=1 Tax=Lacticaseibacillus yichunensis TaxID=2486015 RepID=A0ABW4CPE7_9LACO|nr:type II toxin-antitoxin system PemK/MazF family toxin [Lacticaseibacillus yichunensis]